MSRVRNLGTALVGGVALALAFPDVGWWPLAFVAVAMLYLAIARSTARGAFGLGWMFGMAFFLPHIWWAYVSVGAIPWFALAATESLAIALACSFYAHARLAGYFDRWQVLAPLSFAVLWAGAELLRSMQPFGGFPWGRIAFGVVDAPVANLAYLGGAPLVSLAAALVGSLAGFAVESARDKRFVVAAAAPLAAAGIVILPMFVPLDSQAEDGTLRVGWVQGNVPNLGLDSFAQARQVTINHKEASIALADSLDQPIDLLLWPENSSDVDPRVDEQTARAVTQAAAAVGTPLLLGTVDYSPPNGRYNTSLVWLPTGEPAGAYRKQRPAAFAEYIPIRSIARHFSPEVDRVTRDVLPGTSPAILGIRADRLGRDVKVGPIICFEVAYDWIPRQSVRNGAEYLAVQTNNATFGLTAESTQQLAMSRLRAIETGRTTIQVSTVGVSGVVSPTGRVLAQSDLFTRDYGVADVPLRTGLTPAMRLGWWVEWLILGGAAAIGFGAMYRRLQGRYEW